MSNKQRQPEAKAAPEQAAQHHHNHEHEQHVPDVHVPDVTEEHPFPETEHIEEQGEPFGGNVA